MDFLLEREKEEKNKHISLQKYLHKKIPFYQTARSYKKLYASDLSKSGIQTFCPREYALALINNIKRPNEYINTALAMAFKYGKFYENIIREVCSQEAVGTWECNKCLFSCVHVSCPKLCVHCKNSKDFSYKGIYIHDPIYGYECGLDLVLELKPNIYSLVEIKTISSLKFDSLNKPLVAHKMQVMLYLGAIESYNKLYKSKNTDVKTSLINKINTRWAYILYCIKGFGVKDRKIYNRKKGEYFTPFKEFIIKYDKSVIKDRRFKAKELEIFKQDTKNNSKLPNRICESKQDKRAQKCLLRDICFDE